jgi:hypothetical protein
MLPVQCCVQEEECSDAYRNPKCPYVTVINLNSNCLKNVDRTLIALMGVDGTGLNSGVIHEILTKLNGLNTSGKVAASWLSFLKPIAVSVAITAVTTYLIARFG